METLFFKILIGANFVLIWIVAHGSAFADGSMPMWRWPRPDGAPEWDTDSNGKFRLYCTWIATLMDAGIIAGLIWLAVR